ncbi:hypothetical protein [Enterococcus olivae]
MTGEFLENYRKWCGYTLKEASDKLELSMDEYQILEQTSIDIVCDLQCTLGKAIGLSYLYMDKKVV